jgi:hypothetical protein
MECLRFDDRAGPAGSLLRREGVSHDFQGVSAFQVVKSPPAFFDALLVPSSSPFHPGLHFARAQGRKTV